MEGDCKKFLYLPVVDLVEEEQSNEAERID